MGKLTPFAKNFFNPFHHLKSNPGENHPAPEKTKHRGMDRGVGHQYGPPGNGTFKITGIDDLGINDDTEMGLNTALSKDPVCRINGHNNTPVLKTSDELQGPGKRRARRHR